MTETYNPINHYKFGVIEADVGYIISNGKHQIHMVNITKEEADMLCGAFNKIQIENKDGMSKTKAQKNLRLIYDYYMGIDKTFSERMIVENIFKDISELVFNDRRV